MEKKIKNFIIILVSIFIIILILLMFILKREKEVKESLIIEELEKTPPKGATLYLEENYEFYYSVKEIIEEYCTQISNINLDKRELSEIVSLKGNETEEQLNGVRAYIQKTIEYSKKSVFHQLGSKYIQEFEITEENIKTKFEDINFQNIIIDEMYVTNETDGIYTYLVKGSIIEKNKNIKEVSIMIIVDRFQNCFSIYPQNYMEQNNYYNKMLGENIEISENNIKIEKNQYNTFSINSISKETKASDLFNDFKRRIKYNFKNSSKIINDEYTSIRFDNEQEIIEYLGNISKDIHKNKLDSYSVKENGGNKDYLFKDINGNYYIFKETAPFQYTVMLDNYTIPTEEFVEEYNKSSDAEKVVLNIKRFFMGIDDKNYGFSYSVLAESFKNSKYQTKNDFVNYAKQNFFEENKIEYISYEKENGLYIYKIKLTDATGNSSEEKEFNIILKLNNGTDFEMSFGEN